MQLAIEAFKLRLFLKNLSTNVLRGDFLQIRISSTQKSNESDCRLHNLGKVKMARNFFIMRVFPGSIYKHNRSGLVPFKRKIIFHYH